MEGGYSQIQSHLYNLCVGTINAMMNLEQLIRPYILICVEAKWPGSRIAMAVLGCRSFVLVIIINNNTLLLVSYFCFVFIFLYVVTQL